MKLFKKSKSILFLLGTLVCVTSPALAKTTAQPIACPQDARDNIDVDVRPALNGLGIDGSNRFLRIEKNRLSGVIGVDINYGQTLSPAFENQDTGWSIVMSANDVDDTTIRFCFVDNRARSDHEHFEISSSASTFRKRNLPGDLVELTKLKSDFPDHIFRLGDPRLFHIQVVCSNARLVVGRNGMNRNDDFSQDLKLQPLSCSSVGDCGRSPLFPRRSLRGRRTRSD